MKKAVLTLGAAAVVASGIAIGVVIFKKNAGLALSPAQLLPAETLALAEFPDLKASGLRWKETSLWKIAHEPEVQAFLERPRAQIPKNETWETVKAHFRRASVRNAFVALTTIENNMPKAVGGFAFDGPREEIEALVAKARERAQKASPGGKADLLRYKNFEIESFSDADVTLAGAFAGSWYFAANDVELLKATLDRFSGEGGEANLTGSELYRKSLARVPADPEFRLFLKLEALTERLLALATLQGSTVEPAQAEEIRKMKALAYATRFDGERVRDTFFVLSPGAAAVPSLDGSTLALTSPATFLYFAQAPVLPDRWEVPTPVSDPSGLFTLLQSTSARLSQHDLGAREFKSAFGPEFGVVSDWAPGSPTPSLAAAVEIRDEALARQFVEACCGEWQREEADGVALWIAPARASGARGGPVRFSPALALTGKHLLLGLDAGSLKAFAARAGAGAGETLAKTPAYEAAIATVAKPDTSLGYLDTKALFERLYGSLRPMAMLYAGFVPQLATYIDVAKLPTTEPISRHLLPTVVTASRVEDGFLTESTGSITFAQSAFAFGGAAAAVVVPALQGKLPLPGLGRQNAPPAFRQRRAAPQPATPAPVDSATPDASDAPEASEAPNTP